MEPEDCNYSIIIKEENEPLQEYENTIELKIENDTEVHNDLEVPENDAVTTAATQSTDNEVNLKANANLLHTTELLVKQEIIEEVQDASEQNVALEADASVANVESTNIQVKEEESTDIVSYDYPDFGDTHSMDSNDATALGVVETCLQDGIDIKEENDDNYQESNKEDYVDADIKIESDLTVTETQLTSQQVNTGVANGPPKHSLIMKFNKNLIRNMTPDPSNGLVCTKTEKPDEYNTVSYCNGGDMDLLNSVSGSHNETAMDQSFQLNSITGNMLTLEQQAYGVQPRKEYSCPKCPKIVYSKHSLQKHLGVHQTIENYRLGRIKGSKTRRENQLKKLKQMTDYESESDDDESNYSVEEGSTYQCTCQKVYHRRSRMETCLRSHDYYENKNYMVKCTSCLRHYRTKEELAAHRKKTHRKKIPCKFCPTDYATRRELFKHLQVHQKVQLMEYKVIEEVLKGKQKLRCFMCSKSFTELSELKVHVLTDHNGPYSCLHCERTFSKIVVFANHTRSKHPEVEEQSVLDVLQAFSRLIQEWKCGECGLQFLEADKFAQHKVQEHNPDLKYESQFHCADCGRVFASQKGLTSHRRIHHSLGNTDETKIEELGIMCLECRTNCKDINALTSHMRFHSPDRRYACKFCDFRFATPEKRKAHAELHTGEMKFVCFICEYQCSSENRLKHHKMSLKHINMREYLLTGKPLVEESTSKEEQEKVEKITKKEKRKRKAEAFFQSKKVKSKDVKSSSSSESDNVECDICGEKFPSEKQMLDHKQTHPFIEFPNEDTPTRIFFK